MKFIKLHRDGQVYLVNMDNVSEVYAATSNKSWLFFNFAIDSEQGSLKVDESPDEILELIKQVSQ